MKRGRQSAASLTVVTTALSLETVERPAPPDELTVEQSQEWRRVVDSLPADWFGGETLGLLAQYCRHRVAAGRVATLVRLCEESDDLDVSEYDRLLKMQEREGRALSALATRMRITQQTTYDKSRRKPLMARKPWEMSK